MSAEILKFSDYRINDVADSEIELATAVDIAIRDLREILACWGSEAARQRVQECELTLRRAYSGIAAGQFSILIALGRHYPRSGPNAGGGTRRLEADS